MILSNVEIYRALDLGLIRISPEPTPRRESSDDVNSPFDTHSVDVHLSPNISVPAIATPVDLCNPKNQHIATSDLIGKNFKSEVIQPNGYNLDPHQFILAKTKERVELPIDTNANKILRMCIAARIEGKSSRARCGLLVHFTAPTIHPGFAGTITLEIINLGPAPFVLRPDMAIGQLIFEEVKGLPKGKAGTFQNQSTPEGKSG